MGTKRIQLAGGAPAPYGNQAWPIAAPLALDAGSFPFLAPPAAPDSWSLEARNMTSPADLEGAGWVVRLHQSPWTVLTRAGDVDINSTPSAGTYRSSLVGGMLVIQGPTNANYQVMKPTAAGSYTYKAHCGALSFGGLNNHYVVIGDTDQAGTAGKTVYYAGVEASNTVDVQWVGPSAYTVFSNTAIAGWQADTVKYVNSNPAGNLCDAQQVIATTGVQTVARAPRTVTMTPTHAGVWLGNSAGNVTYLDFIRRTPYRAFP